MSFVRRKTIIGAVIWIAACLLFIGSTALAQKIHVVTTLSDYGSVIESLGGERVEVLVLASPLEDPHYVDPKPSFIVELNKADWLISNGLELEIGWLPKLVVQSRNLKLQEGILGHLEVGAHVTDLIDVPQGQIDRSMGDIHAGGNPHFHNDPVQMQHLLPLFTKGLIHHDPYHEAFYQENLKKLQLQLDELIMELTKQFQAVPKAKRKVVAYHKSFEYLFRTLGIEVVAYLEPKPGVAPTPRHVKKVYSLMNKHKIKVIVQEGYYPSRVSSVLANLTGAKVVKMQGGASIGSSYVEHIRKNANRLYQAIKGESQ